MIPRTATATALALLLASPALALSDARVTRLADGQLEISWTAKTPVDVLVSDQPDAPRAAATLISRADADGRHNLAVPAGERRYFLLHEAGTRETLRTAERVLPYASASNFRDIGGYRAADGKHVRWGRIYRTGGQPLVNEADQASIARLNLANLVDLRSIEERRLAPSRLQNIRYNAVGYSMMALMAGVDPSQLKNGGAVYRGFPRLLAPQLALTFDRLLESDQPLAYNCSAGQDRTGFVTAMILSALGVSRADIIADYHLSTPSRRPENEMPKLDPALVASDPVARMFAGYQKPENARPEPLVDADGKAFLSYALEEIETRYGSIDAYLEKEAGLTPARREALKAAYLE
ncbi:tyrosine-protein phosphatase [Polymorphobacter sp.]|uniref:tyrosine-protein phosphatase n=1 Tax=Polymorphobacter sp. TaxID=1909290 RepID=UPI003F717BD5